MRRPLPSPLPQDTEFPGVVARPVGSFASHTDFHYQTLRCNVDLLKIIQLGLTFSDAAGNLPDGCPSWQFNFKFNLSEDMYAQDSIDLLTRSGISFKDHEERGIDVLLFGELLTSSGVCVCAPLSCLFFGHARERLRCDMCVLMCLYAFSDVVFLPRLAVQVWCSPSQ